MFRQENGFFFSSLSFMILKFQSVCLIFLGRGSRLTIILQATFEDTIKQLKTENDSHLQKEVV
jgi:hypothetical protein